MALVKIKESALDKIINLKPSAEQSVVDSNIDQFNKSNTEELALTLAKSQVEKTEKTNTLLAASDKILIPETKEHTILLTKILDAITTLSFSQLGSDLPSIDIDGDKKSKSKKKGRPSKGGSGKLKSALKVAEWVLGAEVASSSPGLAARAGAVGLSGYGGWELGSYIDRNVMDGTKAKHVLGETINNALNMVGLGTVVSEETKKQMSADFNGMSAFEKIEQTKKTDLAKDQLTESSRTNTLLEAVVKLLTVPPEVSDVTREEYKMSPDFMGPPTAATVTAKLAKTDAQVQSDKSPEAVAYNASGKSLIDEIGKADGGKHGYDSVNSNTLPPGKKISEMTVREVIKYQEKLVNNPNRKKNQSSAIGKYQIMLDNMKEHVDKGRLSLDETFNAETQDRLAVWHATDKSPERRKLMDKFAKDRSDYYAGKLSKSDYEASRAEIQHSLAKEWAALPDPKNGGNSYHKGTGNNNATISQAKFDEIMNSSELPTAENRSVPTKQDVMSGAPGTIENIVGSLRIKDSDGKTTTLKDKGITRYDQLQSKGGQAFGGGYNSPEAVYAAAIIQNELGDKFVRTTAVNDEWHKANKSKSKHTVGNKVDYTLQGISYEDGKAKSIEALQKKGLVAGVDYKIAAEEGATLTKTKGTAPHIDFELTASGKEKINAIRNAETPPSVKPTSKSTDEPKADEIEAKPSPNPAIDQPNVADTAEKKVKQIETKALGDTIATASQSKDQVHSTTGQTQQSQTPPNILGSTVRYAEKTIESLFESYMKHSW